MNKKSLKAKYKERYYISQLDLADSAETNRIHVLIISPILFIFGLADILAVIFLHHDNLQNQIISLIYFGIFTIVSLYSFIYSRKIKNIERNRAYIWKTIPVYMIIHTMIGASLYNFYILGQPFNGFVSYTLTGFISLSVFTFSPIPFIIGLSIGMAFLGPGIYDNFGLTGLADALLTQFVMICISFYKRKVEKKQVLFLKKQKNNLEAKTFGNFTLIFENKVVRFSRTKSNELLGYLIYKNGSSVNSKQLISILWGERADSSRYGSSLRNLIVDIKHTLNQLEIQNFFITEYNNFRINPEVIKCDYYDFLAGDKRALDNFGGEFMSQFSWAEEVAAFLEQKALKK
ncbi:MAG: hypothetical protein K5866_00715 [Treponema sp.]|nr:hypothetical protein [Treponema sp.]